MGLDGVAIVMAIEERFGITISDAEVEQCVTPAILVDLVLGKLATKSGSWTRQGVAEMVKQITIEQLGLKESRYREDARFVEDLGVD